MNELKNKAASIRAKLTNIARAERIDFDALLLRYFQERFIYRLATCEYMTNFVLKGGLFLVCLEVPRARPTKDIDFLAEKIDNSQKKLEDIIKKISQISGDDGVVFNPTSVRSEIIKEETDYEGIRLKITAKLGQARKVLQIDIAFGDTITPHAEIMDFPTILENEMPRIKVYSIESVISEKFEAMIKLGTVNSRMKDFYDIYTLSTSHSFFGSLLKKTIINTFKRRKTEVPESPGVFQEEFCEDKTRKQQWKAFLRKTKLPGMPDDFLEIITKIKVFLQPIILAIRAKKKFDKTWNIDKGQWK